PPPPETPRLRLVHRRTQGRPDRRRWPQRGLWRGELEHLVDGGGGTGQPCPGPAAFRVGQPVGCGWHRTRVPVGDPQPLTRVDQFRGLVAAVPDLAAWRGVLSEPEDELA